MARFGIICEYNPLHRGHVYHLDSARAAGADSVVCIMSGNFTQRAEPAMAHKYTRARAAVGCGADLVIELPFPYCASSAEIFASAGVATADALTADTLFFGSECNDIALLGQCARILCSDAFKQEYQALIKTNVGTAAAYSKAFERVSGHPLPTLSNDLLGIAYCKAILSGEYDISPLCIGRRGANYNDQAVTDAYPSATALRRLWHERGLDALGTHLPDASYDALCLARSQAELAGASGAYGIALLSILRMLSPAQIQSCALCGGGLGDRILHAAHQATDLDGLYALCAHKSLPDSHVRRAVLYAALGVTEQDLRCTPAYLNVLAANARGREILSELRRTCPVPLVTKPADAPDCRQRELSDRADALYTLAMEKPQNSGFFKRQSPFMAL
ncbi:MAG: nucleotidyltransferase family protein [Clostridia bacterium]|nr:nucleotidyltransferase family protein [Clostridia bacterium]